MEVIFSILFISILLNIVLGIFIWQKNKKIERLKEDIILTSIDCYQLFQEELVSIREAWDRVKKGSKTEEIFDLFSDIIKETLKRSESVLKWAIELKEERDESN
jgi:predicted Holliday junction resolvase-like endonuclease